jgi:hypothetical protein
VTKIVKVLLISITLITILSVILVGCGEKSASPSTTTQTGALTPSPTEAGPTAEEIAAASLSALEKITTLKAGTVFSMTLDVSGGSHPGSTTLQENGNNSVDVPAKMMSGQTDITVDIPPQANLKISTEVYCADGWLYAKTSAPLLANQWYKMKLTEDQWNKQSGLSNVSGFLQSAVKIELAGSQTINGTNCYVLNVTPDLAALTDWIQQAVQGQQTGVDLSNIDLAKTFKSFSVKEWVSKVDKLPVQQQITIVAEITPSDFTATNTDFDKLDLNVNGTITYSDYGQPVNIVVPPDALNAQQMPLTH